MNRFFDLFRNKYFLLIFVTVILFITVIVSAYNTDRFTGLRNIINVPLTPVQKFLTNTSNGFSNTIQSFKEIKSLREENEHLKSEINELEKENRRLAMYKDKIDELKSALNLKDQFENYDITGANVVAKEPGNWFHLFKIDVGTADSIMVDYPVVSAENGLVGRLASTNMSSSTVLSILDEDSSVSGWISKSNGGHVIVRGDVRLKEDGFCRMNFDSSSVSVEVGDVIETSGLGGIYPKGILIGKVVQIMESVDSMEIYGVLKPEADFKRLQEVYVLRVKNEE